MATLTALQANGLANNFLGLAQAIGDFRFENWTHLSEEQNKNLGELQFSILNQGEKILAQSTTLVMNDVQTSLNNINDITNQIKGTIKNLENIQKGIDTATAIVTLGSAIIAKNPQSIADSISGIVEIWNS